MAALSIRTGITSATPLAEASDEDRETIMWMRREFCEKHLPYDCRLLLDFVEDGRAGGFAGHPDEDAYIRDGLGLDPEAVTWAIRGLAVLGMDGPVSLGGALRAGQTMAEAQPLAKHGEIGRGRDRGDNGTSIQRGSNSTSYLASRIKRDRPDIAEAVERGEYRSIRQAALAAGIVQRTVQIPVDPERAAVALRRHFAPDELELLIGLLRRKA